MVYTVRTDNAKELYQKYLNGFLQQKGVLHQKSCVYTPQQNGVVQRKHRHILDTAGALFFQSRFPVQFWGECILTAVHIINRVSLSVLNNISPYEMFYKLPPLVGHLNFFGCSCYVSTLKYNRNKFQPRALPHAFIGYLSGQKAYQVLKLKNSRNSCVKRCSFSCHQFIS